MSERREYVSKRVQAIVGRGEQVWTDDHLRFRDFAQELALSWERVRQMEEEIEALHIALRASGERREKLQRQVSELQADADRTREERNYLWGVLAGCRERVRKMEEACTLANEAFNTLLLEPTDKIPTGFFSAWHRETDEEGIGVKAHKAVNGAVLESSLAKPGLPADAREPSQATEPESSAEDTSGSEADFYLDSFHRTWNREF